MKKIAENYNNHVVNLLGAVTIKEPMLLIIEFVEHGDLLSYLRYCNKRVSFLQGIPLVGISGSDQDFSPDKPLFRQTNTCLSQQWVIR